MNGAAGVMALVLAETAAGGLVLLFAVPLWNEVKRGYFKVTGITLAVFAGAAWASIAASLDPSSEPGRWALWLAAATTLLTLTMTVLLFARVDRVARAMGFAASVVAIAWLVALAGTAGEDAFGLALFQLVAGAAFLGSVLNGLLLGHWYLTDRGLSRTPINRYATILIVAVVLEGVAVVMGGFEPTAGGAVFNPMLTSIGLASYIALGMVLVTGLIAVVIRMALKGERASAVQSATGFFYLAVICAFVADLATKVRFLPGA